MLFPRAQQKHLRAAWWKRTHEAALQMASQLVRFPAQAVGRPLRPNQTDLYESQNGSKTPHLGELLWVYCSHGSGVPFAFLEGARY